MAIPDSRKRQLELEAEAEAEAQIQFEQENKRPPFVDDPNNLGPDYSKTVLGNVGKSIVDFPENAWNFGADLLNLANIPSDTGGPIDVAMQAGPEKTAKTIGGFAAGMAGAIPGASAGAAAGASFPILGPWTPLLGGALGAGLGLAGGLAGFDVSSDALSDLANKAKQYITGETPQQEYLRPTDQYIKDAAYNFGSGALGEGAIRGTGATVKGAINKFKAPDIDAQVHEALNRAHPGYADSLLNKLDEPPPPPGASGIPDNRSLAEILNSDSLRSLERTTRQLPENINASQEAKALRSAEQLKALDSLEPSNTKIDYTQEVAKEARAKELANANDAVNTAQEMVDSAITEVRPNVDSTVLGKKVREVVSEGEASKRAEAQKEFGKMTEEIVPLKSVTDGITPELEKYFREVGPQPNQELVGLIDAISKEQDTGFFIPDSSAPNGVRPVTRPIPRTLKDIQALASEASDIAQSADARSRPVAAKLVELLEKAGDDAVASGKVSPDAVAGWKEGRRLWKEKGAIYNSSTTPAKSILAKQPFGEYKLPDSAVSEAFWRRGSKTQGFKGQKEAIDNFKAIAGSTEQALEPLYQMASNSFRRYVLRENKVTGKVEVDSVAAKRWLDDHAEALNQLPELKDQLSNVQKRQQFLDERFGELKRTTAESDLAALEYFTGADPHKAIATLISGKNPIGKIKGLAREVGKDPLALQGLRRGLLDYVRNASVIPEGLDSIGGRIKGATFLNTLRDIQPIVEKSGLFSESQIKLFKELYADKFSELSVENARPAGSPTFQHATVFSSFLSMAGKRFLLNKIPVLNDIVRSVLKNIPEAKFRERLNEALLNRKIARDLAQKATTRNVTKSAMELFKEEFNAAGASKTALKVGAGVSGNQEKKSQPKFINQQKVTSSETFPDVKALTGKDYLQGQSKETRARIMTESSGNPDAVSPKGAQGLSQLMPSTGREIGAELGEPYKPLHSRMGPIERDASIRQNIRFGNYYMDKQLREFGDKSLAWAAYNAGPQAVRDAIKLAGTSRDVNKVLANLPKGVRKETIPYVERIAKRYGS